MINRYSWINVPGWAQYKATDKNGDVFAYEFKPMLSKSRGEWCLKGGECAVVFEQVDATDWQDSLEQRPGVDETIEHIYAIIKTVLQQVEVDPEDWGEEIACSIIASRAADWIAESLGIKPQQ